MEEKKATCEELIETVRDKDTERQRETERGTERDREIF